MAGRTSLGAAEYELIVNNQALLKGFAEAEARARVNAKKVADAVDEAQRQIEGRASRSAEIQAAAAKKAADAQVRETKRAADAQAREAARTEAAAKRAADAQAREATRVAQAQARASQQRSARLREAGVAFGLSLGGVNAIGGGPSALAVGAATVVRAGIEGITEATLEAERAGKALNIIYGESAVLYQNIAESAAKAGTATLSSTQQVVTTFATLRSNYGLTSTEIAKLTELSLQYAAVSGKDVIDVSQRIQSALRGEAEAAEALGLTLNSDAVKAMANMTDEQRRNFETLDQVTKTRIIYNELLRQSENVQKTAVKDTDTLAGSQANLAKSADDLGKALGKLISPEMIAFNKAMAEAVRLTAIWIRLLDIGQKRRVPGREGFGIEDLLGLRPQVLRPLAVSDTEFEDAERTSQAATAALMLERARSKNKEREQEADARIKKEVEAFEAAGRREIEIAGQRRAAIQENARQEQDAIEDKRDADIKASQDAAEAAISALDARQQADAEYYADAITATEKQRDADIRAIESRRDGAIKAIEEEQRALETARRTEDRTREDTREAERRAIQRNHDAAIRAIDDEQRAIERTRDAAIRGIDERRDAEDERHREAMFNLDFEEQQLLGAIDDRLRALDDQARKESRQETDRSLRQGLRDAQRDVRTARTPEERRRAQREVDDAERAIERERRNRRREDTRQNLRDQAEAIRKEFDLRRKGDESLNQTENARFNEEKTKIQDAAKAQLEGLTKRREALQEAHAQELVAIKDRYEQEDRIREDARRAEDEAIKGRLERILEDANAEILIVRETAAARIEALQEAAKARDKYYDDEKKKVQDAAKAEQEQIRATTKENLKELEQRTKDLIFQLERDLRAHQEAAKQAILIWRNAAAQIKADLSAALTLPLANPPGTGVGTRTLREGGATQTPAVRLPGGRMPTEREQQLIAPTSSSTRFRPEQIDRYLASLGYDPSDSGYEDIRFRLIRDFELLGDEERNRILQFAQGGWIREPTLLTNMRTGQPYAIAGERGPEWVGPVGGGGAAQGQWTMTINAYDHRTDVSAASLDSVLPEAARYMADLLNHALAVMPDPAAPGLAGAELIG